MANLLEELHQLRLRVGAHEFLLLASLPRLMLLDPGFARNARKWIDREFGEFSTSELAAATDPQVLSAIRKHYLLLLKEAEDQTGIVTAAPKPKSIRRRMFEWFERG